MANVTITQLELENSARDTDFIPVSDGSSTRKLNLYGNYATTNLSNLSEIISASASEILCNTFLSFIDVHAYDSGLIYDSNYHTLKTALYTVNKMLPNDILDNRNLNIGASNVNTNVLGKYLATFNTKNDLNQINNVSQLDPDSETDITTYPNHKVKVNDYVVVLNDESERLEAHNATTYYILKHFNSSTGDITASDWEYYGYRFEDGTSVLDPTDLEHVYYFDLLSHTQQETNVIVNNKIYDILQALSNSRARIDLLDVPIDLRKEYNATTHDYDSSTVFVYLPKWIASKVSHLEYERLDNLAESGYEINDSEHPNSKGDLSENDIAIADQEYQYDEDKDIGNSRFARKSLNNLKRNGTEKEYNPLTDWGDNRFAHKSIDNLKEHNNEEIVSGVTVSETDYDSNNDWGNSRFARKSLNNLRNYSYIKLSDKIPTQIRTANSTQPFFTIEDFVVNQNSVDSFVGVNFNRYVLDSNITHYNSALTDFNDYIYNITPENFVINNALPDYMDVNPDENIEEYGRPGIVDAKQATHIANSLQSANGIDTNKLFDKEYYDSLSITEQEYYANSTTKKVVYRGGRSDQGTVSTYSALPMIDNKNGDKIEVTDDPDINKCGNWYWNSTEWVRSSGDCYSEDPVTHEMVRNNLYGKPWRVFSATDEYLNDGNIVLSAYNIAKSASEDDWDYDNWCPKRGKSIGETLAQNINELRSNYISKMAEDIHIELNATDYDATTNPLGQSITIKAGSKFWIPNGVVNGEKQWIHKEILHDVTVNLDQNWTYEGYDMIWYNDEIVNGGIQLVGHQHCSSGSNDTIPTEFRSETTSSTLSIPHIRYNEEENLIKFYLKSGSSTNFGTPQLSHMSFPLALIYIRKKQATTTAGQRNFIPYSIIDTYDGFGIFGTCAFILPGLEIAIPNGRDENGNLRSLIASSRSVPTISELSNTGQGQTLWSTYGQLSVSNTTYNDATGEFSLTANSYVVWGWWGDDTVLYHGGSLPKEIITNFNNYGYRWLGWYDTKENYFKFINMDASTFQMEKRPTLHFVADARTSYKSGSTGSKYLYSKKASRKPFKIVDEYDLNLLTIDDHDFDLISADDVNNDSYTPHNRNYANGANRFRVPSADYVARMINKFIPAGTIFPFAGTNIPEGYLECNGAPLDRSLYPELYDNIGTTYGGNGNPYFNLPNLIGRFVEGANNNLGTYNSAGLPNIRADWNGMNFSGSNRAPLLFGLSGAIEIGNYYENVSHAIAANNSYHGYHQYSIDASRSSSIYRNINTVQPNSLCIKYIIKYT